MGEDSDFSKDYRMKMLFGGLIVGGIIGVILGQFIIFSGVGMVAGVFYASLKDVKEDAH